MNKFSVILVLFLAVLSIASQSSYSQAKPLDISDSLVAYYPFNGNANDESGNGNNPIYIGSGVTLTSDRFGQPNKAYYFDGEESSHIRIPADNFPSADRTISFWFYAGQLNNHPTPLSYGGDVCYNSLILMINKGDSPDSYTALAHCGTNYISAPYSVPPINHWCFLTMTISGATQKIFIDGELKQIANTFSTPTVVVGKSVILGALIYTDGNTVYTDPTAGTFKGKLDDFRFYNSAMTDSQVMNLYKSETNGLIAYFPFNGNAIDESGLGHDGTVLGGILTTDRNNVANKAYTFPNLHNQIVLSNSSNLILSEGFTLNTWIKYKNINCGIVGKHNCWVPNGFLLGIEDGQFTLWISNGGWQIIKTNETYLEDKWYMVTAVYDSINNTGLIYIDGEIKAMGTAIYTNFNTASITISEASDNCPSGNMPGTIDEVKIYNRPLSASEILAEYYSTQTGLVAFYPFNGNANDESGNGNHGTITGALVTPAADRYGEEGKAYKFWFPDYISVPTNSSFFTDEFTVSYWYKVPIYWGDRGVLSCVGNQGGYQQVFSAGTTFTYLLGYNFPSSSMLWANYIVPNTPNTWQHVTTTYKKTGDNTSESKLFFNGEFKISDIHNTSIAYPGSEIFYIGRNHSELGLNGELDNVRFYNNALNDGEIKDLYLAETKPVLQYPANQSSLINLTPIMIWLSPFSNAEFNFQLSTDSQFGSIIHELVTNNLSTQLPDGLLLEDQNYYWRVRSIMNGDTGPWSDVWSFNSLNTGFIQPMQNPIVFKVSPNPASTSTKFSYSIPFSNTGKIPVSFEVVNSIGISQYKTQTSDLGPGDYELNLETAFLKAGIYYCMLKIGEYSQSVKLVIIH